MISPRSTWCGIPTPTGSRRGRVGGTILGGQDGGRVAGDIAGRKDRLVARGAKRAVSRRGGEPAGPKQAKKQRRGGKTAPRVNAGGKNKIPPPKSPRGAEKIRRNGLPADYSAAELRRMYRALLTPRLIEEKMLLLLRQGKVSKWFSGIGQEAIAVGCTLALDNDEYILPLHRNLGVFTVRQVPLARLMAQWQGTASGFTKGRDRSFHFGTRDYHIVGMISHLGPQLCVADGIALAHRLAGEGKVTLVFSGEGGTSEGDFHEALNVAAVWDLPVIFVIENNGYGLSTPTEQQYRCADLKDRALGYGIEGVRIDGNDLLEVHRTISGFARELRRRPRPVLVECTTFRMRGHEEASGVKYVPPALLERWAKKDPIAGFEAHLRAWGVLNDISKAAVRAEIGAEIEQAIEVAFAEEPVVADTATELGDVYAEAPVRVVEPSGPRVKRRFVDAISDGLREGLRAHPDLVLMGQDVADYGGVFKVTEGFLAEFGPARIRNTPLCESAILGAALGLAVKGFKSVVEMQFADFVTCGFNQIVNNLAKVHYRWGQSAPVVIRMPTGAGTGAGPFHSQSNEAWFFHTPGLRVVYPATPYDAKGLLLAAIADPNPVMFFEHKMLYRSLSEEIPEGYYTCALGAARVDRVGEDFTFVTYGAGVHWAREFLDAHPELSGYILDLRSLAPLDYPAIRVAVEATHRVLVLHEDTVTGGVGGDLAAWIGEHCFSQLDAPVIRCGSLDTPIPFAGGLEKNFLAKNRIAESVRALLAY